MPCAEARDLDLPQNVRDGLTQARTSLEETKARVKASEARIDSKLEGSIKKNYWCGARTCQRTISNSGGPRPG